jgi:O-antigen ligase
MKISTLKQIVEKWLWVGVLFLLPLTSLPLISRLTGGSAVATPSTLFILLLIFVFFIPHIYQKGMLPVQSKPLIGFILVFILAGILAFFYQIPIFRDTSIIKNELEAIITLFIGVSFYFMAACWGENESDLSFLLKLINIGGSLIIIWSLIQGYFTFVMQHYPEWMTQIQSIVSASGNLYYKRVAGFAYEPSWLAHQLNMLFLPYWLSATVNRTSAFRFRLFRISLENVLLIGGVIILGISFSRVGWLALLVMVAYLFLRASIWMIQFSQRKIFTRWKTSNSKQLVRKLITVGLIFLLIIFYLALFLGTGWLLSKFDPRMAKLFNLNELRFDNLAVLANQLAFAERVVFWQTGMEIFKAYPLLGVGPGNSGYFFQQKMVPFGWGLTEISTLLYRQTFIPNTKSLWVRILAESGIVGFSFFATWLILLWKSGITLYHQASRTFKTLGLAGCLTIIGLLIEGFSIDSFALPYFWLSFGLMTSAFRIFANQANQKLNPVSISEDGDES